MADESCLVLFGLEETVVGECRVDLLTCSDVVTVTVVVDLSGTEIVLESGIVDSLVSGESDVSGRRGLEGNELEGLVEGRSYSGARHVGSVSVGLGNLGVGGFQHGASFEREAGGRGDQQGESEVDDGSVHSF
jgi:hypothetical protein